MKIAYLISRILLGLVFLTFGLNGFLHFIPMQPMPGLAGQFMGAMIQSHYGVLVFLVQIAGGALLLINRYIPLALVFLGPVLVNILLFHITMAPEGLLPGVIATILWFLIFIPVRSAFAGIFAAQVPVQQPTHATRNR